MLDYASVEFPVLCFCLYQSDSAASKKRRRWEALLRQERPAANARGYTFHLGTLELFARTPAFSGLRYAVF
jgi:hypothetical protein